MVDDRVDVLLSTYNGQRYLKELLESLVVQNHSNWYLITRDDGSNDASFDILSEFASRFPEKVEILPGSKNLGVMESFKLLMNSSKSQYMMFCDQDDVWFEDKISSSLNEMKKAQQKYGVDVPLLVHSDLRVVDGNLNDICPSFWKYEKLKPCEMNSLRQMLVQNSVTGCASIFNRQLVESITEFPKEIVVFDWYIALCASAVGQVVPFEKRTLLYRRHGNNVIRSSGYNLGLIFKKMFAKNAGPKMVVERTFEQAEAFLNSMKKTGLMSDKNLGIVEEFVLLRRKGLLARKMSAVKNGFTKHGFLRNLGWLAFI